jgi:hypothetical protein
MKQQMPAMTSRAKIWVARDMSRPQDGSHFQEDLCIHIFTVSAALVGVCPTVIGLLRVTISIRGADTVADELVAVDALLFLVSCLSSYWALRTRNTRRLHRLERFADRSEDTSLRVHCQRGGRRIVASLRRSSRVGDLPRSPPRECGRSGSRPQPRRRPCL